MFATAQAFLTGMGQITCRAIQHLMFPLAKASAKTGDIANCESDQQTILAGLRQHIRRHALRRAAPDLRRGTLSLSLLMETVDACLSRPHSADSQFAVKQFVLFFERPDLLFKGSNPFFEAGDLSIFR
jgi:hypothetical protein